MVGMPSVLVYTNILTQPSFENVSVAHFQVIGLKKITCLDYRVHICLWMFLLVVGIPNKAWGHHVLAHCRGISLWCKILRTSCSGTHHINAMFVHVKVRVFVVINRNSYTHQAG